MVMGSVVVVGLVMIVVVVGVSVSISQMGFALLSLQSVSCQLKPPPAAMMTQSATLSPVVGDPGAQAVKVTSEAECAHSHLQVTLRIGFFCKCITTSMKKQC